MDWEKEARAEISKRMPGGRLDERTWMALQPELTVGFNYDELADIARSYDAKAKERREQDKGPWQTKARRPGLEGERAWALSILVAKVAQTDAKIEDFRKRNLTNGLLPAKSVKSWIRRVQKDEPHHYSATVRIPPDTTIQFGKNWEMSFDPPMPKLANCEVTRIAPEEPLLFRVPGADERIEIQMGGNGVLASLRDLSKTLAEQYQWDQSIAATFVVCEDVIPVVKANHVTVFSNFGLPIDATRIVLSVDPSTSSEEVARLYDSTRQAAGYPRKPHAIGSKALQLAAFASSYETIDRACLRAWNHKQRNRPDWRYDIEYLSNFRRDVRRARRALLGPTYDMRRRVEYIGGKYIG